MEERRTSVFENGLIWFGAAVSIAEITAKHPITVSAEIGGRDQLPIVPNESPLRRCITGPGAATSVQQAQTSGDGAE